MTTAKKAFFLYRDWCIAKYLREDANWSNYPEIFVSAWEYAWNDGFDTVSHESIYTNKNASRYLVGGMVDKDGEGSYYTFLVNKKELAHYLRLRTDWELESHVSTIFIKN